MTTCKDIFNFAMGLMDEINKDKKYPDTPDTKEYEARTPYILETLLREVYYASDTFNDPKQPSGKRPVPTYIIPSGVTITAESLPFYMNKKLDLDDFVSRSILPYGLAAHLLLQEDVQAASFFQQRYEELLRWYRGSIPAEFESVENYYGFCNEYGWFSRW